MVWDWERLGENLCQLDIKFHKLWLWRTLRGGSSLYEGWWVVLKRFLILNFFVTHIEWLLLYIDGKIRLHTHVLLLWGNWFTGTFLSFFWPSDILSKCDSQAWWYHLFLSIQCWLLVLNTLSCLSHLALYPVFYRLLIYEETVSLVPWSQTWKISLNVHMDNQLFQKTPPET